MSLTVIPNPPTHPAQTPDKPAQPDDGPSFLDFLSALNPLQYVPVVGTIYRALTGDRPPHGLSIAGSLLVDGLLGGPIGLAIGAVSTLAQEATGVTMDSVAHNLFASDDPPEPPMIPPLAIQAREGLQAYNQAVWGGRLGQA